MRHLPGSRISLPLAVLVAFGVLTLAHAPGGAAELDSETRATVLGEMHALLTELYVIPETAAAIRADLDARLARGELESLTEPNEFAREITPILYELSGDLHLRVRHGEDLMPQEGPGEPGGPASSGRGPAPEGGPRRIVVREGSPGPREPGEGTHSRMIAEMDGFPRAEILAGNVGLVEVRLFPPREYAEDAAVAAMEAVRGAEALIFDLRGCIGGAPDMVHLITSYLYPPEPRHLLTYYHASTPPDSAYTLAEIPGERNPDAEVFVLTSAGTGSGGEEFAYVLKHHGRATLVGETTAGAGHGGGVHPVSAGFSVFVPTFRPVHPVTGGGWEGVGVVPNVEVPVGKALAHAHREILRRRLPGASKSERGGLEAEIARLTTELELEPEALSEEAASEYVGVYGIRTISTEGGHLFIQRQGGPRLKLVARAEKDSFALEILPDARVDFVRNDTGSIVAVNVRQMNGKWERSERSGRSGT